MESGDARELELADCADRVERVTPAGVRICDERNVDDLRNARRCLRLIVHMEQGLGVDEVGPRGEATQIDGWESELFDHPGA